MTAPKADAEKPAFLPVWELLAPALILAFRVRFHPIAQLWRDWLTVLCLFWIATALLGRTRVWPYVTGAVMAGLLALYAAGQLPQTLRLLGSAP